MIRLAAHGKDDRRSAGSESRGLRGTLRMGACAVLVAALLAPELVFVAAARAEQGQPAEQVDSPAPGSPLAQVVDPSGPGIEAGPGVARFALSPEQREKLRVAREAEARKVLGLKPGDPLPTAAQLTAEQKMAIRSARAAEMRRVLGLAPDAKLPNRRTVTDEQRQKIAAAHEARIREALGLAPDALLPLATPAPASGAPGAVK